MAFRKKWTHVLKLNPDILIIQECEDKSKYKQNQPAPDYNEFIWIGDNLNKGIGIFSFNEYHTKTSNSYSEAFKYIVPIKVSGVFEFNLFAIWAMPHVTSKTKGYVGQIWDALK